MFRSALVRTQQSIARLWLKEIAFSDDTKIGLNKDDVLIIAGPNNCGKSATLRAINNEVKERGYGEEKPKSPVVKFAEFEREGDSSALQGWLEKHTVLLPNSIGQPHYYRMRAGVDARKVDDLWKSEKLFTGSFGPLFSKYLDTEGRLRAANAPRSIAITRESSEHPVHALQLDESLVESISRAFSLAFGENIALQYGGSEVPIRVGQVPHLERSEDRVSVSYLRKLEKLPRIEHQGDGMRSFLGILLFTMSSAETLLLIDEPEAFLHPPQAKHLGRLLVSPATLGRQLIIATHSSDMVKGFLEADSTRARIVRMRRSGDINTVKMLSTERLKELWTDPLLRHSSILDGLFHDRVVVCEADSDCLFYSTIKEILDDEIDYPQHRSDVLFVHCGGKDRLSRVVKSLRELDVPVSVIADFDVLKEERTLQDLVEAFGGDWRELRQEWREIKQAIEAKRAEINVEEVKAEIQIALEGIAGSTISDTVDEKIRSALRRSSPWDLAKKLGLSYVPSGQTHQRAAALMRKLANLGIHVVPVGEMEEFVKSVGAHGPRWVSEVLRKDVANDPEFNKAKEFVKEVFSA